MEAYLVIVRCAFDDIPVYLASSWLEALEYVHSIDPAGRPIAEYWDTDGDDPSYVAIVDFLDGKAVNLEVVRDLTTLES
jgi:hypothetical protein